MLRDGNREEPAPSNSIPWKSVIPLPNDPVYRFCWRICTMTSCARFVFSLRMFPTWRRGWSAPNFGYISPERTILGPVATCAELCTSKGGNASNMLKHLTTQHAVTLHQCKVFHTLLSDGGNSRRGACGTASSVSKVPGNAWLSSLTHWVW